jgi:hypothetical protein
VTYRPGDDEIDALVDRILCARIAREEARRIVFVHDEIGAVAASAAFAEAGLAGTHRVMVNPIVPPGEAWIADLNTFDAASRKAIQHGSRRLMDEIWPP